MRALWREVNEFFASTSIHGFPYISNAQSRSTRLIWTLFVLGGFGVAIYFLHETIDGFSDKYITTTAETRSIKGFPFPAVTFHQGEYNSKDGFFRSFLNEFEFARYKEESPMRNNENFMNSYQWLLSPTNNQLFDDHY